MNYKEHSLHSSMMLLNLFLCKVEIELVDVVKGHLMPVTTKNNQLILKYH